jgi:hypothetical protein
MTTASVWMPGTRRVDAMHRGMTAEQREAENSHAAKLRAQDAALIEGPKLDGNVIVVPSWCWRPEAVCEWKARGGCFHDGCQFTATVMVAGKSYTETVSLPAWTIPARRARLDEVKAIYARYFCREIALAEAAAKLRKMRGEE